jgi:two-component system, NarL family, nitrate/nitrite response regulator NarL
MKRSFETVMVPLREGLARALVATDFRIIASASPAGGLAQTSESQDRSVLLIVDASDEQAQVACQIKHFRKQYPQGRVAVLADRYRRGDVISAYRAGANAYLTKDMSCGAFLRVIELVTLGGTILPPEFLPFIGDGQEHHEATPTAFNAADALAPQAPDVPQPQRTEDELAPLGSGADALRSLGTYTMPRLSTRERCILRCIAEGCSNKSIARRIDIAEATVKVHVKAILRKIRVSNRTQAAIWAVNNSSLVWSATAESPSGGDDGRAAVETRETHLFDTVASVNGAKHDCARGGTQRPVRKQFS